MRIVPVVLLVLLALPAANAGEPGVPDRKFQKEIDKAIEKGADWLREQQKNSGAIGKVTVRGAVHYEIGASALAGLALLAAGDKAGDECVDKIMEYCRRKDEPRKNAGTRSVYDTGTLLMFVIKYYAKKQKKPPRGNTTAKRGTNPCSLPPEVYDWVRGMAQWLAGQQKDAGGWGYPQTRPDLSNTQYALLGLRAARDCGVPIAPTVFMKEMQRTLSLQEKTGPKVKRVLPANRPGEREYAIDAGDHARGWAYVPNDKAWSGSMTTAAIAVLAICHDALLQPRRFPQYTPKHERDLGRAVQDGFSWLQVYWTVAKNAGEHAPNWHYYYLYGLERAAALAGRPMVGDKDWYLLGARYLVNAQRKNGRWSTGVLGTKEYEATDVLDAAFAVLFLARATHPGKPIKAPVITPGD